MELEINQKRGEGQNDSFFYDGEIARGKKYIAIAAGDIRINCGEHNELCYDNKPRNCCCLPEPKTDEDLKAIGFDYDDKLWYDNNNWFEIIGIDQDDDMDCCVEDTYDGVISLLKELEQEAL